MTPSAVAYQRAEEARARLEMIEGKQKLRVSILGRRSLKDGATRARALADWRTDEIERIKAASEYALHTRAAEQAEKQETVASQRRYAEEQDRLAHEQAVKDEAARNEREKQERADLAKEGRVREQTGERIARDRGSQEVWEYATRSLGFPQDESGNLTTWGPEYDRVGSIAFGVKNGTIPLADAKREIAGMAEPPQPTPQAKGITRGTERVYENEGESAALKSLPDTSKRERAAKDMDTWMSKQKPASEFDSAEDAERKRAEKAAKWAEIKARYGL